MHFRKLGLVVAVGLLLGGRAGAQPPGGPGGPPQPGQVLPGFVQEWLNLTAEQKKQVEGLQKEVDAKLAKILTGEQKKALQEMRGPFGGPGGPGGPGGGGFGPFGPAGFGGPGGFGGGFGRAGPLDDVKKQIASSDEEWKVIGPKLQKVLAARQLLTADVRWADAGFGGPPFGGGPGGAFGGFGGPGRPPGAEGPPGAPNGGAPAPPRGDARPGDAPAGDGRGPGPGAAGGPPGGLPPGGGFGGGPMATNAVSQAQADLKTVLNNPKHTAAEIQEKVAAVRKARQKARGDLDAAQKDLLQLLTAEQEAVLVSLGYLD